jgi:hypothetical protein
MKEVWKRRERIEKERVENKRKCRLIKKKKNDFWNCKFI